MNYYLNRNGENVGTFSLEELRRLRQTGGLNGTEFVWREGMSNWQSLDTVLAGQEPPVEGRPPPLPAPPRRKIKPAVMWTIAAAIVLFIGISVVVGILAVKFAKQVRDEVVRDDSKESIIAASQPIVWSTNSRTMADFRRQARDFRYRQYIETYKNHARPDDPCAAESIQFLEAWLAHQYGDPGETNAISPHQLSDKLAAKAGCDDPLVLTIAAANSDEVHEKIRRLERALAGYSKSRYKAYPRFYAHVELAKESSGRTERVRALDNAAIRLFEQCFSDGSLLPGDQAEIADILINGWASGFFSQNRAVVHPIPAKAKGFEWLALVLKGEHHIDEAWKARGGGYANTVSAEGWRAFSEHLGEARASLTEAWKLHPQLPLAPARMVYVAMGNSGAEEMRLWFDRATAAQIDHPGAWSSMRWGLRPRWHGSHETMLALGIAAVDTKRFDTDVPRKFFDVITDIESELKLPRGDRIFGRSDIWPHVQRMYEGYIAEPTVGSVRDGWRSTYAVVAYFAGKYGVAREQLEKLNWAPWPYNLTGWNAELSLMPLEVAARTGALAKDVAKAESRYKAGDSAAALKLYADLNQEESGDERTKRFIQHRLGSLRLEDRLLKQEWVEFLPSADNDPTWVISRGKVRRLEDRGLEVETGDDGSLLYSRARVGPNFEVKGEFEVVSSSNGEFQAGLVMGLPESFSSEWYAFRMKRNKTEGEIASFSRQWTRTQVSKSVGLNDKHNTFRLRLQGGKADAWLNEKQILWKAAPSKSMRLYKDCLLGLGAYHDMNTTVVRYKNVQVRRLPGPESAPDGQEPD